MMNEREIFVNAMQKDSRAERSAYLESACGEDSAMRQRIESLLGEAEQLGSFLESAPSPLGPTVGQSIGEKPGSQIGPYKLLEQIGEGGFGLVYLAEQQQPIRRTVALKIIKPGMDTKQVIARFEVERQALALMDHPNISRVLDAGATDTGRPYFVMELVKGVPITDYCDQCNLSIRQRLNLFTNVCGAVQHAHQKGIIHRDIKPTNVLIAMQDGQPTAKIIDFGVAKAMNQQLTDQTLRTGFSQMLGTPLYMSPEQAEMSAMDVDTRSDIYSMGVMLYELLTGTTPFEKSRLSGAAYDEIRRVIREEYPPKPSDRLSTMKEAAETVAQHRRTEARRLTQLVRGDLDWIVLKALEKDQTRRYETANALARDVERYLNQEPVEACPPSTLYRFRKFVWRNRVAITTAAMVVVVLLLGIAISTWQAMRATTAYSLVQDQRSRAEENFVKAREAVDKFFTRAAEELKDQPHMEQIRRALLEDAKKFYTDFLNQRGNDPFIQFETALAYQRVGEINHLLGLQGEADAALSMATKLLESLSERYPDEPKYRLELAQTFFVRQREPGLDANVRQAKKKVNEIYQELVDQFPENLTYREKLAHSYSRLGGALWAPKSEGHHLQALSIWKHLENDYPNHDIDLAAAAFSHYAYGFYLSRHTRYHESVEQFRQAVELISRVQKNRPDDLQVRLDRVNYTHHFGRTLASTGKMVEAEALMRAAIEQQEEIVSQFPANVMQALTLNRYLLGFAGFAASIGKMNDAETAAARATEISEQLLVKFPRHPRYSFDLYASAWRLAQIIYVTGRHDEASKYYQRWCELSQWLATRTDDYMHHLNFSWGLVTCPDARFQDAQKALEFAEKGRSKKPKFYYSFLTLGVAQYRLGHYREAAAALERSLELIDPGHSCQYFFLAMTYWNNGEKAKAKDTYNKGVDAINRGEMYLNNLLARKEAEELLGIKSQSENKK